MGEHSLRRRLLRAAAAVALAGLTGACGGDPQTAAPVILKGTAPEGVASASPPTAAPSTKSRRIVVRRGQSLGGIARDFRVPQRTIIAANQLKPPYKIQAGQRLTIPGASDPPAPQAIAATKSPMPTAEPPVAATKPPAPPTESTTAAKRPPPAVAPGRTTREVIPLDDPAPPANPAASARMAVPPPAASGSAKPSPPPKLSAAEKPPPKVSAAEKPPPKTSAAEQPRAETAAAQPPRAGDGHFPWPVRGPILAGYGAAQGGGQNNGINIAAPRGAAIRAVDAGVVAYAGNEIRGYGNLVLVKHPNGFISAYAHSDELLVKRGDKVGRGQVIAKVGATGGVSEPQLHFELRRGKRAVDPRDFLEAAPSAGSAEAGKRG